MIPNIISHDIATDFLIKSHIYDILLDKDRPLWDTSCAHLQPRRQIGEKYKFNNKNLIVNLLDLKKSHLNQSFKNEILLTEFK